MRLQPCFTSPQIEKGEDKPPHEIDEMPVQAGDFHDLVISFSAGKKASALAIEITAPDLSRNNEQEDDADGHVSSVKSRDHEKARAELLCTPSISPGPNTIHDQLCPLKSLHADEHCPERRRPRHQDCGL